MSARRDSRTEDEIRKEVHEMNSTQTNFDIETLTGLRIRNVARVTEEDEEIRRDVQEDRDEVEEDQVEDEKDRDEELYDVMHKMMNIIESSQQPEELNWSFVPVWIMSFIIVYLYGVTLGLYMCPK